MVLIRERDRQPRRQVGGREDPGGGAPFGDGSVQVGVDARFCGVMSRVHDVGDELAHLLGRQVSDPREDLGQDERNRSGALGITDQAESSRAVTSAR